MPSKTYSLRPPAVAKDNLEALFKIEMRKDDLAAQGLQPGDAISLVSQISGKGGVGVAALSTDTTKAQGNVSFVKINPKLREFMGLDLTEKCSIAKFDGPQRRIQEISVAVEGFKAVDEEVEEIEKWAGIALAQLPCIASGAHFTLDIRKGLGRSKKVVMVTAAVSCEGDADTDLAIPYWFDYGYSKVTVVEANKYKSPGDTQITIEVQFTDRETQSKQLPGLSEQLETLSKSLQRINNQIEDRYKHLAGCVPILLHGPSGTGKSEVLRLVQRSSYAKVVNLSHAELSTTSSKSKTNIMTAFSTAVANQPSLMVIDDLQASAGRNQEEYSAIATLLCDQIQHINGRKVQILAATRRIIDIDRNLLSCFKTRIELSSPTPAARLEMLKHFSAGLADDDTLGYVAGKTHAFTASDLDHLCFQAYQVTQDRGQKDAQLEFNGAESSERVLSSGSSSSKLTKEHFQHALSLVHPSLMNELYIEVPKVYWSDIAGSAEVKHKLWEAVELPLKHPEVVSKLNLQLNHGILLYGPPGCSKTMTAKALATESGLNFIAVKGPELVSKYVGESEYKIREIFRKARAASPSVIFFDEIDSIAPNREGGGGHEGLNTVATLLNEMDGVEDVQRVLVLAATNRPDAIDPALLRPGRLGTSLYVGPPDYSATVEILKMRTSRMCSSMDQLDLTAVATNMIENGCFSGADIGAVCDAAGMICAHEAVQEELAIDDIALRQDHLVKALANAKPSLSKEQLHFLQTWSLSKNI